MNHETVQHVIWTLIGGAGLAVMALHHRWNKSDAKARREWRRREIARRISAKSTQESLAAAIDAVNKSRS